MKKILFGLLGLLFSISANAACNLYTTTNSSAGYIDTSGVVQYTDGYLTTDYISITPSTEYTVYARMTDTISGHGIRIAFYDTNKQFIAPREGGEANSSGRYIYNLTSPANAKYIRMSTSKNSSVVVDRTIVQGRYTVDTIPTNLSQCATCDGQIVTYTSATGTGVQNGTPTPTNPIEPVFYTQGDMMLRKVGDYADSYDATTGKITRRVGVKVFDGTEQITNPSNSVTSANKSVWGMSGARDGGNVLSTHFISSSYTPAQSINNGFFITSSGAAGFSTSAISDSAAGIKSWLQQQYNAGTPVVVYYQLAEAVEEDWLASYCQQAIKIASTKYVETQFSGLSASLAAAVATVNTVVTNTITQAASIATLQSGKQTRPDETCPAYKQCLLVEDESGTPHWYQITDPFRDFVAPIIANNVAPSNVNSTKNYIQLEYIESTGTQYIDTGVQATGDLDIKTRFKIISYGSLFGVRDVATGSSNKAVWVAALAERTIWLYSNKTTHNHLEKLNLDQWYDADIKKGVLSFNGNEVASYETENFTGSDIFLFNTNEANGSLASGASVQISYFKIYDASGTLVRNFVPVIDNATGKVGLYDTVGGWFYGNAATSGADFTPGPIVENDADVPGATWTATWDADATTGVSAGTVSGITWCNTNNNQPSVGDEVGGHCWCKATQLQIDGKTTSAPDSMQWGHYQDVTLENCTKYCGYYCSQTMRNSNNSRNGILRN